MQQVQPRVVVTKCSHHDSPKPLLHPSLNERVVGVVFPLFFSLVPREVDDSSAVMPDTAYSYCEDYSLATGVTVWASAKYVYGIILECAALTATCAPPNAPDSIFDSGMSPEHLSLLT